MTRRRLKILLIVIGVVIITLIAGCWLVEKWARSGIENTCERMGIVPGIPATCNNIFGTMIPNPEFEKE
jgi:hypothetical protein